MEDLSYSDLNRLKYLNAILLTELTVSHSDMERMKYLNMILMTKFKDFIQIDDNVGMSENEDLEVNHDLNDETTKEISSDSEIQILNVSENEIQEEFHSPINEESKYDSFDQPFSQVGDLKELVQAVDHDFNDETIKEIPSDSEIHISIVSENERQGDFDLPINDESTCDTGDKSFPQMREQEKNSMHTVHEGQNTTRIMEKSKHIISEWRNIL